MSDAQLESLLSATIVVEEPGRAIAVVSGSDRATWLNGVVTCEVAKLAPGEGAFGLLLSKQGKIQSDFYLVVGGERLLLAFAPGTRELALGELGRMLVMEDAEIEAVQPELACACFYGPGALELSSALASKLQGHAAQLDRAGLGSAVLLFPEVARAALASQLDGAGARFATEEEWLRLRVAHGIGLFGVDYGASDNPHEAGLERRAISWTKGCYLGQEVVFMQDARGKLKRRLSELQIEGGPVPLGTKVLGSDGAEVGEVTSVVTTSGNSAQALARLKAPYFEPGAVVAVAGRAAVVRERKAV
jgi:folate-binding protein YgfZ